MTEVSTPNSTTVVVTIVATPTLPDCPTPPPTPASELELDFASDPEERGQFSVNYYNEAVKKYGQNNILQTIIGMVYAAEFGDVRYSIPEFVLVEAMSRSLYQEFKVLSTGGATPTLQEPPQSCRGDLYCDDSTKILILWLSRIQGWYSAVSFADIDTKFSTDEEYFRNRASDIMAATDPTWKDGIDSNGERPYDWGNQLTTEETTLAEKQYSQGELGVMPNSPCSSFFGFYYVARSSGDYPWFVIRSFFQKYRTVVPDATSCSID
jgi:hypothetical protein